MSSGRIEVICGGMFSGKSEELVRRLRGALIASRSTGRKVKAFKHALDDRYHKTSIGCHTGDTFEAHPLKTVAAIESHAEGFDVIGIDEVQFFDEAIIDLCERLADRGKRVIVAGLDQDFQGNPFGPMPRLLAKADYITKLHAVCSVCGDEASKSLRLTPDGQQVVVGTQQYEARCRKHWLDPQ